jgi:hypothetical protein
VSAWSGTVTDNRLNLSNRQILSRKLGVADLGSNSSGDAVAIWRAVSQPTATGPVSAAIARPGRRFARAVTITRERAASASVAMNASGDTAVVWQVGGRLKARIKRAHSRAFGEPLSVGRASAQPANADPSAVAVDPTGAVAVAWQRRSPTGRSIVYATARPGGDFTRAIALDRTSDAKAVFTPTVAAIGSRRFVIAWTAPQPKSAALTGAQATVNTVDPRPALGLRLAADPSGRIALAWRLADGDGIWFTSRSATSGFEPPELAVPNSSAGHQVAIDPKTKTPVLLLGDTRSLAITFRTP